MNKNIYHRYLKLPIQHKKPACFNTEHNDANYHVEFVQKDCWDLRFIEWLKNYKLRPKNISDTEPLGFYTRPDGGGLPIHNDSAILNNIVNINFTWGPLKSTTRWWKLKNGLSYESELCVLDNSKKFLRASEKNCDLVYEQVIHTPSLMNVGQLHNTYNPDKKKGRWTLSYIILKDDDTNLQFNEALEIFKDVAYE